MSNEQSYPLSDTEEKEIEESLSEIYNANGMSMDVFPMYRELAVLSSFPPLTMSVHYKDFVEELEKVLQKITDVSKPHSVDVFDRIKSRFDKQINEAKKYMSKYNDVQKAHREYIKDNKKTVSKSDFGNRYRGD